MINVELLQFVSSELDFLYNEWNQDISIDSLRRSSKVLRVLLVEGNLLKAWYDLKFIKQPKIAAISIDKIIRIIPKEEIVLIQAGGGIYKGIGFCNAIFTLDKKWDLDKELEKYKLSKFLDSTCIYFENISIKRREVITYVCNKLGGVHFDKARNSKNEIEKKYILLDKLRDKISNWKREKY